MLRFAQSYKDLNAEVTSSGNVRIFDKEGTLFVVKPTASQQTDAVEFAKSVLAMVAEHGIGGAISRTNAIVGPRMAQVLEYAVSDMDDEREPETPSLLTNQDSDTKDKRPEDKKTETATETGSETDHKEEYDVKGLKDDVLVDRNVDFEDEKHEQNAKDLNVTVLQDSDTRQKREDFNLGKTTLDDVTLDHQEKQSDKTKTAQLFCEKCNKVECECKKDEKKEAAIDLKKHTARLETIAKYRLDKKIAELEKEKETFKSNFTNRFIRAMKIIAHRQALNLEDSPLKMAMCDVFCNPRELGDGYEYNPMDQQIASTLIEASFSDHVEGNDKPAWEDHVDRLASRTSEVMAMSDEVLLQTEADLKNLRVVNVPITIGATKKDVDTELKTAASKGNLQLSPSPIEHIESTRAPVNVKRNQIRQAMGNTKIAGLMSVR